MKKTLIIILTIFLASANIFANEESHENVGETTSHKNSTSEKFQPGPFIFEHILNSHDWHILTYKGHPVSIPLPVIIWSKYSGFHIFMSSKFEHGHAKYEGLQLCEEGDNKGKIIEVAPDGSVYLPIDISISKNVLALFISLTLLIWIFTTVAKKYRQNQNKAPTGIQNLMEPIIMFIRDDVAKAAIGEKKYEKFMPYLLTIFFFIWLNNMMGIIPIFPGGYNLTGNITITMVLALFTFVITTINGNKQYWTHIVNTPGVPWWLKIPVPLMPVVEVMGVFTKPFVLMVRLFANMAAGHIIALGFISLIFIFGNMSIAAGYGFSVVSVLFVVFMTVLELLVAFIQAYVFTLLSALYFGMAIEEHH